MDDFVRSHASAPRTGLALFDAALVQSTSAPAILYFDQALSYAELDARSTALAQHLQDRGFLAGDRLAVYLQNVPQFVVAMLACWKAGGIVVPVNPMNRTRELGFILGDCTPAAIVMSPDLHGAVYRELPAGGHRPRIVLACSPWTGQSRNDTRIFKGAPPPLPTGVDDLDAIVVRAVDGASGRAPIEPVDDALIVYTSGTSGVPKGAVISHGAYALASRLARAGFDMPAGAAMLAMAPLFHVTGLVSHIGSTLAAAAPLILTARFEPSVVVDAIVEHRPFVTTGATTAYIALMDSPNASPEAFASLKVIRSGGAPMPPAIATRFQAMYGLSPKSGYGLTETCGATHLVPLDVADRVDAETGALSVGVPIEGVSAWIADDEGRPVAAGELGEIVVSGPCVSKRYWGKDLSDEALRTGDIGKIDADGWLYLVDRKKDMISASGFKVWPREVEDVIHTHPAVREVAVVGVPDPYRGETVKAFVALRPGQTLSAQELVAFCKNAMAAYKYPRLVEFVAELPKTATGKILRRELREAAAAVTSAPVSS